MSAGPVTTHPQDRVIKRPKTRRDWGKWGLAVYFVLFLLFLYTPMLLMGVLSFQGEFGAVTFPFRGPSRFRDLESAEEVVAEPSTIRRAYLRELAGLTLRLDRDLRGAGIDYVQLDTSQPLDFALLAYLATRARRK